jgi:hypothetical protein
MDLLLTAPALTRIYEADRKERAQNKHCKMETSQCFTEKSN